MREVFSSQTIHINLHPNISDIYPSQQAISVLLSYPQTYKVNPKPLAAPHGRHSKAEIRQWSLKCSTCPIEETIKTW